MATVYLAQDLRHDRQVAIKVLREDLGAVLGPERFLAEVRTTARLQHRHILPLLDSGQAGNNLYYVTPFVAGESLRERLGRHGPLQLEDAIQIAREVADALGAAHLLGIVHRDIKPENILLQGGHALVADFGIALAVQQAGGSRMTQTELSLGTPQYMAPEQAMGERTVDHRADIYALGAVTYEMLVGEPPFTGATVQIVVAKMMTERPVSPSALRDTIPAEVEAAVLRALGRLPGDRFASAADFASALGAPAGSHPGPRPAESRRRWTEPVLALVAVAALIAAAVGWMRPGRAVPATPTFGALMPPPGRQFAIQNSFGALSPDGRRFAFISTTPSGDRQLWLRDLAAPAADSLPNTTGAEAPFWAPDGRSVGYLAQAKVWRLDLDGTSPRPICDAPLARSAAWGSLGDIVVLSSRTVRLGRADGTGCSPRPGDSLPNGIAWTVSFFPDGRRFLVATDRDPTDSTLRGALIGRVDRPGLAPGFPGITAGQIVAPDVLVYATLGSDQLLAQRFDPERLEFVGSALPLGAARNFNGFYAFAASGRAVLYLSPVGLSAREMTTTGVTKVLDPGAAVWTLDLAHDGRLVAYGGYGLWIYDRVRETPRRISDSATMFPVWGPGDTTIAVWQASPGLRCSLVLVDLLREHNINVSDSTKGCFFPSDWTRDGRHLVLTRQPDPAKPRSEIWRWSQADRTFTPEYSSPAASVSAGRVSPDGRWLAYVSDETGGLQVFIRPFLRPGPSQRVSAAGGANPRWSWNGRWLLYITPDGQIMRVAVPSGDRLNIGRPERKLLITERDLHFFSAAEFQLPSTPFMVTPDPDRFLILMAGANGPQAEMILDWMTLLDSTRARPK